MNGVGDFHKLVPRNLDENVKFRSDVMKRAENDLTFRQAIWEMCKADVLFYINGFVYQYNPKKKGRHKAGPFVSWKVQDKAIFMILKSIEDGRDLVIEKSREMGASWLCLIIIEWLWHFHPFMAINCISRNEALVESEKPDSLFWKIDFIHRYLPVWLMPKGVRRRKLFFGNDDYQSTISGEASTGKAGVGGRCTLMFIDEFSQINEDFEVLHRTSDTADCRIFNGTHLGLDTAFYELTKRRDMRKLQMHWTDHPDKCEGMYYYDPAEGKVIVVDKKYRFPHDFNFVMDVEPLGGPFPGVRSPWYDLQCSRKGDRRAVAMDLDINPEGTVSQFFNPMLIRNLLPFCCPAYWEGYLEFDPKKGTPYGFVRERKQNPDDRAYSGLMRLWVSPDPDGGLPLDKYAIGCDPAFGTGATPSCTTVIRTTTGEKILEYADPNIKAHELAGVLVALSRLLRSVDSTALLIWEQLGPGVQLALYILKDFNYRNVYYRESEIPNSIVRESSNKPGWVPGGDNKRLLLAEYSVALETRRLINRSEEALKECLKFKFTADGKSVVHPNEENTEDPSGARVNHGDRTMADALAWKAAQILGEGTRKPGEEEGPPILSLAWRRQLHENRRRQAEEA